MDVEILYEDAQLAVCVKPAGVLSEEGGMPELLRQQLGGDFFCVHRLDKPAAGVMVYARTGEAAASLGAQIAAGRMRKQYLALVQGVPETERGSMKDLLYHDASRNKSYVVTRQRRGVREALLDYELLGTAEWEDMTCSGLRIVLHTGRSHQIRVQLASRGMPLIGDGRYGSALRNCPLALFSEQIGFFHPTESCEMLVSSPPPETAPWALFDLRTPETRKTAFVWKRTDSGGIEP